MCFILHKPAFILRSRCFELVGAFFFRDESLVLQSSLLKQSYLFSYQALWALWMESMLRQESYRERKRLWFRVFLFVSDSGTWKVLVYEKVIGLRES